MAWIAFVAAFAGTGASVPNETPRVQQSFERLREALARGDGEAAAGLLTDRSFVWFADARQRALGASRGELAALAAEERLVVLALRHRGASLLRREGQSREVLAGAVASGGLDPSQVRAATLGPVEVDGVRASAPLRAGPLPAGLRAAFAREGGAWKLDLGGTAASLRATIRTAARVTGASEDVVILTLLAAATGQTAGPGIWDPPAPPEKPDRPRG